MKVLLRLAGCFLIFLAEASENVREEEQDNQNEKRVEVSVGDLFMSEMAAASLV